MFLRRAVLFPILILAIPTLCPAQGRWDKLQQKVEEIRPKGKWIQQVKESLEGDSSTAKANDAPVQDPKSKNITASSNLPKSKRLVPAQSASRKSILNTSRNLSTGGVVLGIQVDPGFLPSQKLVVSEVDANSPAGKAGIRTGDQITALGGIPTNSLRSLDGVLDSLNGGDQVVVEFLRNRKPERALVRFEKLVEKQADLGDSSPDQAAVELPPTPDLLDLPLNSLAATPSSELQSVLSNNSEKQDAQDTASRPSYFPADVSNPAVVRSNSSDATYADDNTLQTPTQLRIRIRDQQLLIEQLQLQIQQMQFPMGPPADGQTESDALILDPKGN